MRDAIAPRRAGGGAMTEGVGRTRGPVEQGNPSDCGGEGRNCRRRTAARRDRARPARRRSRTGYLAGERSPPRAEVYAAVSGEERSDDGRLEQVRSSPATG